MRRRVQPRDLIINEFLNSVVKLAYLRQTKCQDCVEGALQMGNRQQSAAAQRNLRTVRSYYIHTRFHG